MGHCLRSVAILAASLFAFCSISASADDGETVLKARTPWNVDYGEERCRLAGIFEDGDRKAVLLIDQWWPGDTFNLTVASTELADTRRLRKAEISLFDEHQPIEVQPGSVDVEGYGRGVILTNFSFEPDDEDTHTPHTFRQIETESAAKAKYLKVDAGRRTLKLDTGPMSDALKVLNACSNERLKSFGVDAEKHLTMQRMPVLKKEKQTVQRIQNEYPWKALQRAESAVVNLRINVDENGQPGDCHIYEATAAEVLESPACRIFGTASFEPALDAEGRPMKSYYTTGITYQVR